MRILPYFDPDCWHREDESLRQPIEANRECTAGSDPEQRFVCYGMAPNTNLTAYLESGCDAANAESKGSTGSGSNGHQITSHLTAVTSTGNMGDSTFLPVVDGNMAFPAEGSIHQFHARE